MRILGKFWAYGVLGLSLLSGGLLVSDKAYAAGACGNCKITSLGVTSTGYMMVSTALDMAGPCANKTWMVFDTSTVKGKALQSVITAAYLSGTRVDIAGTNGCTTTAVAGLVAEALNSVVTRQ